MSNWKQVILQNMDSIGSFIKDSLIKGAKDQGHITDVSVPGYSKTFEDSIFWEVSLSTSSISVKIYGNDYILEMDKPQRSTDVRYDPRDMLEYARRIKGNIPQKELLAYMVGLHKLQLKEGVPTKNAAKYSQTGKRVDFISDGVDSKRSDIMALVDSYKIIKSFTDHMASGYAKAKAKATA